MNFKAIDTEYKGYRFRSRLEARWAVFFDACRVPWRYELVGFELPSGWYLPDFWIPNPMPEWPNAGYWVEIKGQEPSGVEKQLALELAITTKHTTKILVGDPGEFHLYWAHNKSTELIKDTFESIDFMESESDKRAFFALSLIVSLTHSSDASVREAIKAARSARFEHGETP